MSKVHMGWDRVVSYEQAHQEGGQWDHLSGFKVGYTG